MITLDFTVDEGELRRSIELLPKEVRHLDESLFRMPLVFEIDNVKFLDGHYAIYGIAAEGLAAMRELRQKRSAEIMPPYDMLLRLEVDGDHVVIGNSAGQRARVLYDDLLAAWRAFANKIRELLAGAIPDLVDHRTTRGWFRREGWP